MSDDPVRAFLADSLALWRVAGTVEIGRQPVVAVIRADTGTIVWVERAVGDVPFRWAVRWRAAGDAPATREVRPRMCGSLAGALNAVRNALGVDRGSPVRIASAPSEPPHSP